MNRNTQAHFALAPTIDVQRSIFDRSSGHMTSFNSGELIPIYCDEILPGDSVRMTTSKVIRAQTLINPTFANIYADVYWFFVPARLTWTHWQEFCGENTESAWIPQTEYQIPSISAPSGGFATGTIADYMGLPVGIDWDNTAKRRPSALPFRAYARICDEWFRSEVVTDPLNIPYGDSNQTGTNGSSYINDVANGGMPFKVAKLHDYFTSAQPSPSRGPNVSFSLLNDNKAEVVVGDNHLSNLALGTQDHVNFYKTDGTSVSGILSVTSGHTLSAYASPSVSTSNGYAVPSNLWADLSSSLGAITVNELRLAFQLQKFYEKQALGGRYIEILKNHFGVTSPDARLQRTEYLGGNRIPIQIHEVTNTTQTQTDFLGDIGAKSQTSDIHEDFERSFVEHGFLIGLCCIRYDHTYAQGLERFWSRRKFEDFYWPVFQNLGFQPLYDSELYADATTMANDSVFAYQEYASDYRFKPDRVSGELRPGIQNSLASWTLSDYYTQKPTLSDAWLREDKNLVDRVLAVTSANANQFFADFWFNAIWTRPMPTYSIPGLIDHH